MDRFSLKHGWEENEYDYYRILAFEQQQFIVIYFAFDGEEECVHGEVFKGKYFGEGYTQSLNGWNFLQVKMPLSQTMMEDVLV